MSIRPLFRLEGELPVLGGDLDRLRDVCSLAAELIEFVMMFLASSMCLLLVRMLDSILALRKVLLDLLIGRCRSF